MGVRHRRAGSLALLFLGAALTGCPEVEEFGSELPAIESDRRYDLLFPYYVEVCALTQIRSRFADAGGSAGHGAMYLKGACLEPVADFPTLRVCPDDVDLTDPESGVGVSVNKVLRNVNWLAVPGKRLFYRGNLGPDDPVDRRAVEAAVVAADRAGAFRGISIHESDRPAEDTDAAWLEAVAAHIVATDFALSFGRTAFCARLPLGRRQLQDMVEFLNDLNRDYARGGRDYAWSGYNDNCSHAMHNALAAAGVWSPKSVASYRLGQLANLSVPANEFADLALLITGNTFDDVEEILDDDVLRTTLARRGWLPVRHGAMVELRPILQNNELFETEAVIFQLHNPLRLAKRNRVGALYSSERFTDLEANLLYFQDTYRRVLDRRRTEANGVRPDDPADARARAHLYAYVETQLADVERKLARLRDADAERR